MKKIFDLKFLNKIGDVIQENGSTLTMVGGLLSLAGALWAAYKASDEVSRANKVYAEKVREINASAISDDEKAEEMKQAKTMRIIRVLDAEKWTIALGGTSAGMIFLTKYLDGIAISGLTAVALAKQNEIKAFAANAKELLSEEDFQTLEDRVLEAKFMRNFFTEDGEPKALRIQDIIKNNAGKLYVDSQDGVMFYMNKPEDMEQCLEWAKEYCARNHELTKHKYYEHLGIAWDGKCEYWGPENQFDAYIGQRTFSCGITVKTIEHRKNPRLKVNNK